MYSQVNKRNSFSLNLSVFFSNTDVWGKFKCICKLTWNEKEKKGKNMLKICFIKNYEAWTKECCNHYSCVISGCRNYYFINLKLLPLHTSQLLPHPKRHSQKFAFDICLLFFSTLSSLFSFFLCCSFWAGTLCSQV